MMSKSFDATSLAQRLKRPIKKKRGRNRRDVPHPYTNIHDAGANRERKKALTGINEKLIPVPCHLYE